MALYIKIWVMVKFCLANLELGLRGNFFLYMQSHNLKKDLILKLKTISRTCFVFIIAFMVYE